MKKTAKFSLALVLILLLVVPARAQESSPVLPVYVVQPGDTLWNIARELFVPYREFLSLNDLTEESTVVPGDRLLIPGLEGVEGVVATIDLAYGESLSSLSRRYQVPEDLLIRLNRLTSPLELYSGVSVVLVRGEESELASEAGERIALRSGQTPLEAAVEHDLNPWRLPAANQVTGKQRLVPGDVYLVPGSSGDGPGALPGVVRSVDMTPERFRQGKTVVIKLGLEPDAALKEIKGHLGEYELHFFPSGDEMYVSLQGIHAQAEVGLEPLSLQGTLPDGTNFAHQQMVRVYSGNYPFEQISGVPMETVGRELTANEEETLTAIASPTTARKFWQGQFGSPVPEVFSNSWLSLFGNRRSFNGSGYFYFHSGLDFPSGLGGDIYAPAPGRVVYTGRETIHGKTTMIDHGWGIYTLYAHQSQILVEEGQRVKKGALIGEVGSTGRSSGPHLHWEVWVGGVQVDPMDWLERSYP